MKFNAMAMLTARVVSALFTVGYPLCWALTSAASAERALILDMYLPGYPNGNPAPHLSLCAISNQRTLLRRPKRRHSQTTRTRAKRTSDRPTTSSTERSRAVGLSALDLCELGGIQSFCAALNRVRLRVQLARQQVAPMPLKTVDRLIHGAFGVFSRKEMSTKPGGHSRRPTLQLIVGRSQHRRR